MCIRVLKGSAARYAGVGDVIVCAVKQAVREGKIEQGRYERYLTFLGELREAEKKQYK